jgi:hypothetical protein
MKRTAAVLAATLLALSVCEGILRIVAPRSSALYVPDPEIGVRLEPFARGRWVSPEFSVAVEINSLGFRDREPTIPKPAGTFRIVAIGDSYVEALQVPLESAVHRRLEEELRAEGFQVDVVALGIGGAGTGQELLWLRRFGRLLEPDLVLLFFNPGNDVADNHPSLKGDPRLPYFGWADGRLQVLPFVPPAPWKARLSNRLRNASHLYGLVRDALYRIGQQRRRSPNGLPLEFSVYAAEPGPLWEEAWKLTEGLLAAFASETAGLGAGLVAVLVPNRIQMPGQWKEAVERWPGLGAPQFSARAPVDRALGILEHLGVPTIDLVSRFAERALRTGDAPHYGLDGHWNPTGHRWAAEELRSFLVGGGYLEAERSAAANSVQHSGGRRRSTNSVATSSPDSPAR